jgi:hypothetical protein
MKKHVVNISKALFICLILYVIVLVGGFFGVKYGLTNTAGMVDNKSDYFQNANDETAQINEIENGNQAGKEAEIDRVKDTNYCQIRVIGNLYPVNAQKIIDTYEKTGSDGLIAKMILAVNLRLLNNLDFQSKFSQCETDSKNSGSLDDLKREFENLSGQNVFPWIDRPEWQTIKEATSKDKDAINKAGQAAGIEPRLIVSNMIVEQLRLFNSEREIFKEFFEPLKILGNANKISLGIMGIKETTASEIEDHLKDPKSEYYLGENYENILSSLDDNTYDKLTSEKDNHYISYLYGALYLRQFLTQWQNAGYDIKYRPEIIGTLFNVGFPQSKPNPNPKVGGSAIDVGDGKYSFGSLVYEFYYSGELTDEFPYIAK